MGFYQQHKIMQSDKTATMRSLLQLSMIDPLKRDPEKFWLDSGEGRRGRQVDMVKFEEFCKDNPQLVRRLREGLRAKASNPNLQFKCTTPEEILQYLADNRKVVAALSSFQARS